MIKHAWAVRSAESPPDVYALSTIQYIIEGLKCKSDAIVRLPFLSTHHEPRLAGAAEMGRAARAPYLANGALAARARLTGFTVHCQKIAHLYVDLLTHPTTKGLYRLGEHASCS